MRTNAADDLAGIAGTTQPAQTMTMDDIRRALVHISPSCDAGCKCLGIVSGEFVLTCAHLGSPALISVDILHTPLYDVRRLHDGTEGTLTMFAATNMDFMALAPDTVFVNMSECGPTEDAFNVLLDEEGDYNDMRPSALEFGAGHDGEATLPGFFFSPDGSEVHDVELEVRRDWPLIRYHSDDVIPGCSGGPIFTRDLHLIGISANSAKEAYPDQKQREGLGRRIDLCSPVFLHRRIQWRTLRIS
ncbi:MAG: hypothetical protein K8T26_19715 [Lentisphaerae bacterium]|nr:hypothetical protein [Lentisphaerota bacterium]